jgi:hypothetical protein
MNDETQLTRLFGEYKRQAKRATYVGGKRQIAYRRGYAWRSLTMGGRWCFIPAKSDFNTSNIVLVKEKNLINT